MSAFMVADEQIDLILTAAVRIEYVSQQEDLSDLGNRLLAENRDSVSYRYDTCEPVRPYTYVPFPEPFTLYDADNAVRGFIYQSCEHPHWRASWAIQWANFLKVKLQELFTHEDRNREGTVDDLQAWAMYDGCDWNGGMLNYRGVES